MKIITAKDFQIQHSAILKKVTEGAEYEVTFHRKPLVRLIPVELKNVKKILKGSPEAFQQSLRHTVASKGDLRDLPYKELRDHMLVEKHGNH